MSTRYTTPAPPETNTSNTAARRKLYPSDLSDADWAIIAPLLPPVTTPPNFPAPKYSQREVLNAALYLLRTGCSWRSLPRDFPPWETVYARLARWRRTGVITAVLRALHIRERRRLGREDEPTLGIIDSQSTKTTEDAEPGTVGYDAGKKVKGRKRHVLVDTTGTILAVLVTVASVQDRDSVAPVLRVAADWYPSICNVLVDGAYTGEAVRAASAETGIGVEVVKRNEAVKGFLPVRKRWIVERTFGWLNRFRRLSKDYEGKVATSTGMVELAMVATITRRHGRLG